MLILPTDISADTLQQNVLPIMSVLVHDLRQPLSVIDACADYLNLVLPSADHAAREQLELLQQQVGEANRIMHEALLKIHYTGAPPQPATAPAASSRSLTNAVSAAVVY
jgi:K+-sensing histidine kinase KdpD